MTNPFTMDENEESVVPSRLLQEVRIMLRHSRDRALDKCVLRLDPRELYYSEVETMENTKQPRNREWRRKREREKTDLKTIKLRKRERERLSLGSLRSTRPMAYRWLSLSKNPGFGRGSIS